MSSEPPREPTPGQPSPGQPSPGQPSPGEPALGQPAPRARRRPSLLEVSIWVGVAGTGIYAIGTGLSGMLNE